MNPEYSIGKVIIVEITIGATAFLNHINDISIIDIVGTDLSKTTSGAINFFIGWKIYDRIDNIVPRAKDIQKLIIDLVKVERTACQKKLFSNNINNLLKDSAGDGNINSRLIIRAIIYQIIKNIPKPTKGQNIFFMKSLNLFIFTIIIDLDYLFRVYPW